MEKNPTSVQKLARKLSYGLVRLYQLTLSPLLGPRCRFHPTCSNYAILAINRYGVRFGGWLTVKRVIKCHPFSPGGYDPVPKSKNKEK